MNAVSKDNFEKIHRDLSATREKRAIFDKLKPHIEGVKGDRMNDMTLQTDQERRCAIRLQNDAAALEAASSDRMQVAVNRFGARVKDIVIAFPQVTTALYQTDSKAVSVCQTRVRAKISPNAGNTFPYPLGPPMVQVFFPSLPDDRVPWLSGLLWIGPSGHSENAPDTIPSGFNELVAAAALRIGGGGLGIPCLWRQGEWHWDRDLLFIAGQLHSLLTDPGVYSPQDAMNPAAAFYWAANKGQLPFEQPIFTIEDAGRYGVKAARDQPNRRFKLVRLE